MINPITIPSKGTNIVFLNCIRLTRTINRMVNTAAVNRENKVLLSKELLVTII